MPDTRNYGLWDEDRHAELESEVPAQLCQARDFIKDGKYSEAKQLLSNASEKNSHLVLPGVEGEIRILYKRLKEIKPKTKKVAAWAV
ncbi:MAG: hypothetical protein JJV92_01720 [Desulfosarcina sp.]|nr:hypothetical protein [Desulfobacterales bacterium]